ncbi:MAG: hypothetical protein ABEL51_03965 [Salinibacter sp.]
MSTPGPIKSGFSPPSSAPSAQSWGAFFLLVALAVGTISCGGGDGSVNAERFNGTWSIHEERSTDISPWNGLTVQIDATPSQLTLERIWDGNYGVTVNDSMTIPIDGEQHRVSLQQWPDNRHIGATLASDSSKTVSAEWLDNGRTLRVTTRLDVRVSQGITRIRTYSEYRVSPDGGTLTLLELRSTRPRPLHYTFVPAESS